MQTIKKYLPILLVMILFASCEKDIEFNGEITAPLLVVNSYITPDSVVSAHVSESRFFLKDSVTFKNITNAVVEVWVNDVKKEEMTATEKGIYMGTYKPVTGDRVKLIIKVPTKKAVNCEALIAPAPTIISIDTTDIWTGERYQTSTQGSSTNHGPTIWVTDTIAIVNGHIINYTLKFKDDGNSKNYYRLIVQKKEDYLKINKNTNDTTVETRDNYYFDFSDIVSGNNSNDNNPLAEISSGSDYNKYHIFTDELINGKEYALTFSSNEDTYEYLKKSYYNRETPLKKEIYIYLQSISKDYYLYLKSRSTALNGDNFFSEQVQIHNNIAGGIGILGSYTSSVKFKYTIN